ncbi:MAG: hypothetical protein Q7V20_03430 [Aquabacterium sp.]|uniref:hypothetical protein n=1 Tax=Aquabacterium sp. TaxID=1872578 RepID=UPI00272688A4|nr:hypothetical protein [Aquabacterium sp.]MDO9002493.1 hypothetical protein [Aquabacterium sp.]
MTATARKVLADLEAAHELLELESNAQRFRITWVAAMALCRAVGHVLDKVDSKASPELKAAIKQAWSSWQSDQERHGLFHLFIESERNAVLKEYEMGFMSGSSAVIVLPEGSATTLSDELFCPLADGPYAGEDCRDILAQAIDWWQSQLRDIDQAICV